MQKTHYINKAVGSETKKVREVKTPVPVDPIEEGCRGISELRGNAYQKARHAYLRRIKQENPKLLDKVLSLLVK